MQFKAHRDQRFEMNLTVVKNAIGSLDKLLSQAKEALWVIQRLVFEGRGSQFENAGAAMQAYLEELHDVLLVTREAADMPATRASLVKAWPDFEKKGLSYTRDDPEFEISESPALTFLS